MDMNQENNSVSSGLSNEPKNDTPEESAIVNNMLVKNVESQEEIQNSNSLNLDSIPKAEDLNSAKSEHTDNASETKSSVQTPVAKMHVENMKSQSPPPSIDRTNVFSNYKASKESFEKLHGSKGSMEHEGNKPNILNNLNSSPLQSDEIKPQSPLPSTGNTNTFSNYRAAKASFDKMYESRGSIEPEVLKPNILNNLNSAPLQSDEMKLDKKVSINGKFSLPQNSKVNFRASSSEPFYLEVKGLLEVMNFQDLKNQINSTDPGNSSSKIRSTSVPAKAIPKMSAKDPKKIISKKSEPLTKSAGTPKQGESAKKSSVPSLSSIRQGIGLKKINTKTAPKSAEVSKTPVKIMSKPKTPSEAKTPSSKEKTEGRVVGLRSAPKESEDKMISKDNNKSASKFIFKVAPNLNKEKTGKVKMPVKTAQRIGVKLEETKQKEKEKETPKQPSEVAENVKTPLSKMTLKSIPPVALHKTITKPKFSPKGLTMKKESIKKEKSPAEIKKALAVVKKQIAKVESPTALKGKKKLSKTSMEKAKSPKIGKKDQEPISAERKETESKKEEVKTEDKVEEVKEEKDEEKAEDIKEKEDIKTEEKIEENMGNKEEESNEGNEEIKEVKENKEEEIKTEEHENNETEEKGKEEEEEKEKGKEEENDKEVEMNKEVEENKKESDEEKEKEKNKEEKKEEKKEVPKKEIKKETPKLIVKKVPKADVKSGLNVSPKKVSKLEEKKHSEIKKSTDLKAKSPSSKITSPSLKKIEVKLKFGLKPKSISKSSTPISPTKSEDSAAPKKNVKEVAKSSVSKSLLQKKTAPLKKAGMIKNDIKSADADKKKSEATSLKSSATVIKDSVKTNEDGKENEETVAPKAAAIQLQQSKSNKFLLKKKSSGVVKKEEPAENTEITAEVEVDKKAETQEDESSSDKKSIKLKKSRSSKISKLSSTSVTPFFKKLSSTSQGSKKKKTLLKKRTESQADAMLKSKSSSKDLKGLKKLKSKESKKGSDTMGSSDGLLKKRMSRSSASKTFSKFNSQNKMESQEKKVKSQRSLKKAVSTFVKSTDNKNTKKGKLGSTSDDGLANRLDMKAPFSQDNTPKKMKSMKVKSLKSTKFMKSMKSLKSLKSMKSMKSMKIKDQEEDESAKTPKIEISLSNKFKFKKSKSLHKPKDNASMSISNVSVSASMETGTNSTEQKSKKNKKISIHKKNSKSVKKDAGESDFELNSPVHTKEDQKELNKKTISEISQEKKVLEKKQMELEKKIEEEVKKQSTERVRLSTVLYDGPPFQYDFMLPENHVSSHPLVEKKMKPYMDLMKEKSKKIVGNENIDELVVVEKTAYADNIHNTQSKPWLFNQCCTNQKNEPASIKGRREPLLKDFSSLINEENKFIPAYYASNQLENRNEPLRMSNIYEANYFTNKMKHQAADSPLSYSINNYVNTNLNKRPNTQYNNVSIPVNNNYQRKKTFNIKFKKFNFGETPRHTSCYNCL